MRLGYWLTKYMYTNKENTMNIAKFHTTIPTYK